MKQIDVSLFAPMIVRDDGVACTESAERFAERKMEIERPAARFVITGGPDRI
jgi:hypothetical protein